MLAEIIPGISTADKATLAELGLFAVTAILATLTGINVRQTTKLVQIQTEPFVYLEATWASGSRLLLIFIKNRGGRACS